MNGIGLWNKEFGNKFLSFKVMFPGDGRTSQEKELDPSNFNFLNQSDDGLIVQVKFSQLKWKKSAREEIYGPLPENFKIVVE